MGGPRASTDRMIRAGKRCFQCHTYLGTPERPGERACIKCDPTIYRVTCSVNSAWVLSFVESGPQVPIGPWLLSDQAQTESILRWGHVKPEDWKEYEHSMRAWGQTTVPMYLSAVQRAALIERRRGWPFNGFELLEMRAVGKYPPQRLTPEQEAAFMRRYRKA